MNVHENVRDSCLVDRLTILELANVTEEDLLRAELEDLVEINIDSDGNFDSDSDEEADFEARDAYIRTVDRRDSMDLSSEFAISVANNEQNTSEETINNLSYIANEDRAKATKKVSYLMAKSEEENIRHKLSVLRETFFRLQEEHARYKFYHFAQKKLSVDTMRDLELQIAALEKELSEKIGVSNTLYSPEFDSVDRGTTAMTLSEEYEEVKKLLTKQLKIVAYSIDVMIRKTRDIQYEMDNSLLMTAKYRQTLMEMMITNNERVTVLKDYQRKLHKQMTLLVRSFPIIDPALKMARIKQYWKGDEALLVSMRASIMQADEKDGYTNTADNPTLPTEQRLLDSIKVLEEEKKKIKLRTRSHDQGKITSSLVDLEVKIAMAKIFFHKTRCLSLLHQLDNLHSSSLSSSNINEEFSKEVHFFGNKLTTKTIDSLKDLSLRLKEEIQAMILIQSNLECFMQSIPIFRRKFRRICVEAIQSSKHDIDSIDKHVRSTAAWEEFLEPIFRNENASLFSCENSDKQSSSERKSSKRFSLFSTDGTSILTASTRRSRSQSVSSTVTENSFGTSYSDAKSENANIKNLPEKENIASKVDIEMNSRHTNPDVNELILSPVASPSSVRPIKGSNAIFSRSKSSSFGLLSFRRSKEHTNPVISRIDAMIAKISRGLGFSFEALPLGVKSILVLQEEMDDAKFFCKKELQNALERLRKIPFFQIHRRNEAHEDHLSIALRERQLLELCTQIDQVMTQFVLPSIPTATVNQIYLQAIFDEVDIFTYVLGFLRSHLVWQGKSAAERESIILKNEHIQLFHDGLEMKIRNVMNTARSPPTVQEGVGHVFPCYETWFIILQIRRDVEIASENNQNNADIRGMLSLVMNYKRCQRIWEHCFEEFEELQMEYEYWNIALLLAKCGTMVTTSSFKSSSSLSSLCSSPQIVHIHEEIRVQVYDDNANNLIFQKNVSGRGSESSVDSAEEEQLAAEGFGLFFQPLALELSIEGLSSVEDIVSRCKSVRQQLSTVCDKLYAFSKCPILYRLHIEQYLRFEDTNDNGYCYYVAKSIQEMEKYNDTLSSVLPTSDEVEKNLFPKIQHYAIWAYYRCILHYQHWNRVYLKSLSEIQAGSRLIEDFGRAVSIFDSGYHRCQCPRYEWKCLQLLKRIEQYERALVSNNNEVAVTSLSQISYSLYWEKTHQQYQWFIASQQSPAEKIHNHADNITIKKNDHTTCNNNSDVARHGSRVSVNAASPISSCSRKSLLVNPVALTCTIPTNPLEVICKLRRMNNGLDRNRYLLVDAAGHFSSPSTSNNAHTALRFRDDTLHLQELGLQLSLHMNFNAFLHLWHQQQQHFGSQSNAVVSHFSSSVSISSSSSSPQYMVTGSDTMSTRVTEFMYRDTGNSSVLSRRRTLDYFHTQETIHGNNGNSHSIAATTRSQALSLSSLSVSNSKPSTFIGSLSDNSNYLSSSVSKVSIHNTLMDTFNVLTMSEFNQYF